jgi:hypothetical protein
MEEDPKSLISIEIDNLNNTIEIEREQKFVNLLVEIIVTITLNELNEKSDQILKV